MGKGVLLDFKMLICVEIGQIKDVLLIMCLNLRKRVLKINY